MARRSLFIASMLLVLMALVLGTASRVRAQCAVPPADMAIWWPLDEAPGAVLASDIMSGLTLKFENGPFAVASNPTLPQTTSLAVVNRAVAFDGKDDRLISASVGKIINIGPLLTFDLWVNHNISTTGANPKLVGDEIPLISTGVLLVEFGLKILPSLETVMYFKRYQPTAATVVDSSVLANIPAGDFRHLAVTLNGATVKFYEDGGFNSQATLPSAPSATIITAWVLGSKVVNLGPNSRAYFPGVLDEVEIFRRELNPNEIARIHLAKTSGKCDKLLQPRAGCAPLPSGMVAWWGYDESSGDKAYDKIGISDGLLNPGFPLDSPVRTAGPVRNALSFDGVNDRVDADEVGLFADNQVSHPDKLTIDAWVNPVTSSGTRSMLSYLRADGSAGGYSLARLPNGLFVFDAFTRDLALNTQHALNAFASVEPKKWTHVALTFDSQLNRVQAYIDGLLRQVSDLPGGGQYNDATGDWAIGTHFTGYAPFAGSIDEVEVFDGILTAAQIARIYEAGPIGKCEPALKFAPIPSTNPGCVLKVTGSANRLAVQLGKNGYACARKFVMGQIADPVACMTTDPKNAAKITKLQDKIQAIDAAECADPPAFGYGGLADANAAPVSEPVSLVEDVFGSPVSAALLLASVDPIGAGCQVTVLKGVTKLADDAGKDYEACLKGGYRAGAVNNGAALEGCFGVDRKRKLARDVQKLEATLAGRCPGVTLSAAFPGDCAARLDLGTCLAEQVRCRVCRRLDSTHGLTRPCDLFDDGAINATCPGCGNGVVEGGEGCDDGNRDPNDGCDQSCQVETCGNNTVDPGEDCDDGNRDNGDGCEADCKLPTPVCGNEVVESGEDCDDGAGLCAAGSAIPGRSCNSDDDCDDDPDCVALEADCSGLCQDVEGGDAGTPCAAGVCNNNALADACRADCQAAGCGDGIIDTGEQCDDSNTDAGDGCSATCQLE